MRHVFTAIALISLLLCLGTLALLIGTFTTTWTMHQSQTDTRSTSLSSGEMELHYDSAPRDTERTSTAQHGHEFAGIAYTSFERNGQSGMSLLVPEYYLVILFAILPLLWVWDLSKSRARKKTESDTTADTGANPVV